MLEPRPFTTVGVSLFNAKYVFVYSKYNVDQHKNSYHIMFAGAANELELPHIFFMNLLFWHLDTVKSTWSFQPIFLC
jgi:copper(I)-binding protein